MLLLPGWRDALRPATLWWKDSLMSIRVKANPRDLSCRAAEMPPNPPPTTTTWTSTVETWPPMLYQESRCGRRCIIGLHSVTCFPDQWSVQHTGIINKSICGVPVTTLWSHNSPLTSRLWGSCKKMEAKKKKSSGSAFRRPYPPTYWADSLSVACR